MLASIQKLHDAMNANHITYCHWKSNEHLFDALDGTTDLDILFLPSERDKVEVVLGACGLKRFRATPNMQYNGIEDYIGFDEETAQIWHLHLHYRMTLGEKHLKGYTLPWGDYILESRIYNEEYGVYTSNPNVEYFLIVVRTYLKLRWRDLLRSASYCDEAEVNWLRSHYNTAEIEMILDYFFGNGFFSMFEEEILFDSVSKVRSFSFQRALRKKLKVHTGFNIVTSYLMRTLREFNWLLGGINRRIGFMGNSPRRRVSPSGGSLVVFLGSDGAGKSTTLKYVKKEFSKKIDVKSMYLGSGDGSSSILRYPMRFVAKRVGGKGVGKSLESESDTTVTLKKRVYGWAKALWAVTLAYEKKRKLKKIVKMKNRGILVLTDRYPQTTTPGYNDGPLLYSHINRKGSLLGSISRWEYRIYDGAHRLCPDLVLRLYVPPEVAMLRKPEMTREEIDKKIEAVRKIDISQNTITVHTDVALQESLSKVMSQIWNII